MKKYIFNVLVAGMVATQAVGYGVNEDDGLVDACFHMDKVFEDDIDDVVLISVEPTEKEEQA
jgi:hypothetical protein